MLLDHYWFPAKDGNSEIQSVLFAWMRQHKAAEGKLRLLLGLTEYPSLYTDFLHFTTLHIIKNRTEHFHIGRLQSALNLYLRFYDRRFPLKRFESLHSVLMEKHPGPGDLKDAQVFVPAQR